MWLGGDHTCCGELRHVGQVVRLALAFSRTGKVRASRGSDQSTAAGDGTVTITGTAGGKTDSGGHPTRATACYGLVRQQDIVTSAVGGLAAGSGWF